MRECIFNTPGKLPRFARKAELQKEAEAMVSEHFGEERDSSQLGSLLKVFFGYYS